MLWNEKKHTVFSKSFCNHELRHINSVLQEVRDDTLCISREMDLKNVHQIVYSGYSLFCPFDISVNKHLVQASLDDRRNQTTIVPADSLHVMS